MTQTLTKTCYDCIHIETKLLCLSGEQWIGKCARCHDWSEYQEHPKITDFIESKEVIMIEG